MFDGLTTTSPTTREAASPAEQTSLIADLTSALNCALSYANPCDGDARTVLGGCLVVLDQAAKFLHGPDAKPTVHHHLAEPDAAYDFATDHYLTVSDSLHEVARRVDGLAMRGLPEVSVEVKFWPRADTDEQTVATIDAIGLALLGESGAPRENTPGRWMHFVRGEVGSVRVDSFKSIESPERQAQEAEIARLKAEIARLQGGAR